MSFRELLSLLHAVEGPIIGADIVELNPPRDVSGITAAAANTTEVETSSSGGR